jgi:hypothetical protein
MFNYSFCDITSNHRPSWCLRVWIQSTFPCFHVNDNGHRKLEIERNRPRLSSKNTTSRTRITGIIKQQQQHHESDGCNSTFQGEMNLNIVVSEPSSTVHRLATPR